MGLRGWVALVVLVSCLVATPAVAQDEEGVVVGRPDLVFYADDAVVDPGNVTTLDVYVANSGDVDLGGPTEFEARVTTARNVRFRVATERLIENESLADGVEIRRGSAIAGNVPPGVSGPYPIALAVAERLPPGTYTLPIEVTYDYTNLVSFSPFDSPVYTDRTRTEIREVAFTVPADPRFRVQTPPGQRIVPGDYATYRIALTNVGAEPARNLGVSLTTDNSSLFFGPPYERAGRIDLYVPRLAPGETRVLTVTVGASEFAAPGSYLVEGRVTYDDSLGVTRTSDRLVVGVTVEGG